MMLRNDQNNTCSSMGKFSPLNPPQIMGNMVRMSAKLASLTYPHSQI
jgi:hypothetical protein